MLSIPRTNLHHSLRENCRPITTLRNFLKSLISLTFDTALNRPALIAFVITAATQRLHNLATAMTGMGHSRPARAGTKPGHVRYAPIAIKFRSEAKCRDVPTTDIIG
jgi:hypothetical protein